MRAHKIFRVTAVLEVLFAFTIFFDPVSTASLPIYGNDLARRADETAGIGVEIEFGDFIIEAKNGLTPEQLENIKGAEMIPVDFDGGEKTNWKLTAEIPRSGNTLFPEGIVDGLKNKVGAHKTGAIGEEMFNLFVRSPIPNQSPPTVILTDLSYCIESLGPTISTSTSYNTRLRQSWSIYNHVAKTGQTSRH